MANYDVLFEKGLITFDNKGFVVYSSKLNECHIRDFGGDKFKTLNWLDEYHLPFFEWHRDHIFKTLSTEYKKLQPKYIKNRAERRQVVINSIITQIIKPIKSFFGDYYVQYIKIDKSKKT